MNVVVKLFAGARELAGKVEISVEVEAGCTIEKLRTILLEQHPELQPILVHAMFALDTTYCDDTTVVPKDAEVACIPPVSGG